MDELDPIKILIADDTDTDRMILSNIVRKQGHEVVEVCDGLQAVEAFKRERPEIVLLDALMPNMDGFDAAREIKQAAGEELVPIIFLTSLQDAGSLARCLEAGGDDFLSKPYNRLILHAKIKAFNRMRLMHKTVQKQRDQISQHNEHLINEQEVAKQVFDKVTHSGCVDAANIKYMLSPMAVFNGDVLLAAMRPSGSMLVFLGDFTGHGLPAAIGAMPLAGTFYGMAQKGFSMSDILREMNQKLKNTLPVGVFCCGCMIDMNFRKRRLNVWLGGLPDCYLQRENGSMEAIKSSHLPLGVLSGQSFDAESENYDLDLGDRFFMWSDGIHEAINLEGEMFGEDRLKMVFEQNNDTQHLFDDIRQGVADFIGEGERDDDISLVEVMMVEEEAIADEKVRITSIASHGPKDWSMQYEVAPSTIRVFNPLPLLLNVLMEVPGLRPHSGSVYTILAELYSNALEHGVLGLSSQLKSGTDGFVDYYNERTARMEALEDGFVRFCLSHDGKDTDGKLTIRVVDSGPGFDYQSNVDNPHKTEGYCGRGIPLIRSLCDSFEYCGDGNEVEAVFSWSHD